MRREHQTEVVLKIISSEPVAHTELAGIGFSFGRKEELDCSHCNKV